MARLLPAVSGTPSEPSGPGMPAGSSRKKTKLEFRCNSSASLCGVLLAPCPDSLHRRLFQGQLAALHQHSPDRFVGMAILIGIADSDNFAILEFYAARALDLQEKQVDLIIHPQQFLPLQGSRVTHYFGPAVVRYYLTPLQPAAQSHVFELRINLAQIYDQKLIRGRIDRITVTRGWLAAAFQQWFVVARDQALAATVQFKTWWGIKRVSKNWRNTLLLCPRMRVSLDVRYPAIAADF